jgi:hypothetical protein
MSIDVFVQPIIFWVRAGGICRTCGANFQSEQSLRVSSEWPPSQLYDVRSRPLPFGKSGKTPEKPQNCTHLASRDAWLHPAEANEHPRHFRGFKQKPNRDAPIPNCVEIKQKKGD